MKLLLTSAGITNKTIKHAMQDLLGKSFKTLSVAFIPTAANVESGDKAWLIDNLNEFKQLGIASLDIVDISALPKDIWEHRLSQAQVLIFGGGNTYHLMYWLEKSGLKKLLPKLLESKVYVGISAGSMVTTKY